MRPHRIERAGKIGQERPAAKVGFAVSPRSWKQPTLRCCDSNNISFGPYMRGYWDIERSTSHCISFVEAEEVDAELADLVAQIRQRGFRIAYVDCAQFTDRPWEIGSTLGTLLMTDYPPYHEGEELNLVRWLDDLISLAYKTTGVVMVLDNADQIFVKHRRHITQLMEAFLVQFHHWLEQEVPCHLCLQMSPHPLVKELFGDKNSA